MTSHRERTNRLSSHSATWLIRARGQCFSLAWFPWRWGETAETVWAEGAGPSRNHLEAALWIFTIIFVFNIESLH